MINFLRIKNERTIKKNRELLLKKINNKIIFKIFSFFKLPMAIISGLKIEYITKNECETSVSYKFLNKNPFNSTYFAVLSMAAELSTGALALLSVGDKGSNIAFIITGMNAEFLKRAKGKTKFKCLEGKTFFKVVDDVMNCEEPIVQTVKTIGYDDKGEIVAIFNFRWSFKKR